MKKMSNEVSDNMVDQKSGKMKQRIKKRRLYGFELAQIGSKAKTEPLC